MQALGAGVLALVVAPDTVVGLVQRTVQVSAVIGQLEALAAAQVITAVARETKRIIRAQRDQLQVIELARGLEQHAVAVLAAARIGACSPCCIARRKRELVGVGQLVLLPGEDLLGKCQFAEIRAEQLRGGGFGVERGDILGLDLADRDALHEGALHRVERCEFMVAGRQGA